MIKRLMLVLGAIAMLAGCIDVWFNLNFVSDPFWPIAIGGAVTFIGGMIRPSNGRWITEAGVVVCMLCASSAHTVLLVEGILLALVAVVARWLERKPLIAGE